MKQAQVQTQGCSHWKNSEARHKQAPNTNARKKFLFLAFVLALASPVWTRLYWLYMYNGSYRNISFFSRPSQTKCTNMLHYSKFCNLIYSRRCACEHACLCYTTSLIYFHISFLCPDSPLGQHLWLWTSTPCHKKIKYPKLWKYSLLQWSHITHWIMISTCRYDVYMIKIIMSALRIKNTSESDPCSYEVT